MCSPAKRAQIRAKGADAVCAIFRIEIDRDSGLADKLRGKYPDSAENFCAGLDIYPGSEAPVIGPDGGLALLKWGFPLAGSKRLVFNARSETADKKELFRACCGSRCAVPFTAFYEWGGARGSDNGKKQKYIIRPQDDGIYYMAAFYAPFVTGGKRSYRFVILTQPSYGDMARIHPRVPVILASGPDGWVSRPGAAPLAPRSLGCALSVAEAGGPADCGPDGEE
jgi:putative SOS response-associated peptidase YedK